MPPPVFDQAESFGPRQTLPEPLPAEPFALFRAWFDEAHALKAQPNPNCMTLATVDPDGRPSARIVLCKGIDAAAGWIVFFTNRASRKGDALAAHPRAAAVFHWDHLDRQVRLEGPIVHSPDAESDAYFNSRHPASRIGAWASDQSRPIASRAELFAKVEATIRRFDVDLAALIDPDAPDPKIPRPPHWGGYRLWAQSVELWTGSDVRIHDRALWQRTLTPNADGSSFTATPWTATRLQP